MKQLEPINQLKLFGLERYFLELVRLNKINVFPNKILLSGQKGLGKTTLAYHFINYILSKNEKNKYDIKNFEINSASSTFKTILNKSNTNLISIDVNADKKNIDIDQIRKLIIDLNKSSFNTQPRFVLINDIDLLNINSINALLKILEEPNDNIYFLLINNNKKIPSTILSRCIDFKINLTNHECLNISHKLLGDKLENLIHKDLMNYYFTPGIYFDLVKFANSNNYDLLQYDLKNFLKFIIKENLYKKDPIMKYLVFYFI